MNTQPGSSSGSPSLVILFSLAALTILRGDRKVIVLCAYKYGKVMQALIRKGGKNNQNCVGVKDLEKSSEEQTK